MRVAVLAAGHGDLPRALETARALAGRGHDVVLGGPDETPPALPPGVRFRPTWWRELTRREVTFANRVAGRPAPLEHARYLLPADGISNFDDCDHWVVAGALRLPLAPVKPAGDPVP